MCLGYIGMESEFSEPILNYGLLCWIHFDTNTFGKEMNLSLLSPVRVDCAL